MNWVLVVLLGGVVNASVNYGYKVFGTKVDHAFLLATVMMIGAVGLGLYALLIEKSFLISFGGREILYIVGMGFGTAITWMIFVHVLTRGMISLADPLWACVYALVSILIGMGVAAETPKVISLLGVGLYIVGAFLIALGARKNTMKGTNHV